MPDKLVTLTPRALEALAREWFARGFRASGYQFHGERPRLLDSVAVRSLLDTEFTRQWAQRRSR